MAKVYLDTCIPFRPFQDVAPALFPLYDSADLEWHEKRVNKSKELIALIRQGKLKWLTSAYFIREFAGLTMRNPENRKAINENVALKEFLRETYKLARKALRIPASEDLEEDAEELAYLSATHHPRFRLDVKDSCHIIASFRAQVDRFLTYDHESILNRHANFITSQGKQYNPDFNCEDPADTGFPTVLDYRYV
jgi:predicted nucleic acid-binding protein